MKTTFYEEDISYFLWCSIESKEFASIRIPGNRRVFVKTDLVCYICMMRGICLQNWAVYPTFLHPGRNHCLNTPTQMGENSTIKPKYRVKIIYSEKLERNINRNTGKFSKISTFLESSRGHGYLGILSMERKFSF